LSSERTLCAAFQARVAERADEVALRTRGGERELTWREYDAGVRRLAARLHGLGLRRGDPLALMLRNRPEFHLVDAAAMHLGAIPFSVYNTSSPEQVEFVVRDSGARIAVVEEDFRERVPAERVLTPEALESVEPTAAFDFDDAWEAVRPEDPLTLIYTSGTTGDPKAVELTHANMVFAMAGYDAVIGFPAGGDVVSYLPMAHIAERNCSHYFPMGHGFRVTCCPDAREVIAYLPEVRPAWFFAVPRIWEKLKAGLEARGGEDLRRAIETGDEETLAGLRAQLGLDRAKAVNVGAAPTPPEVIEFFHSIGLPLGELWGMSETTAIGACNPPGKIKIGTVGPAVPGVQLRLADDGEIEVRGPCVTPGYRGRPDLTRETFTADGWLQTGDIGELDADGYLTIVDRKKELIISAGGKNMSPANIESRLKASSTLIGSAVVIGDRRPYNVALIVLDPDAGAPEDPEAAVAEAVETANASLSNVEQIKRFRILDEEWAAGGDELTPTMKLKRKPIHEKYASEIEGLYA
jgi:long-chain acyl-CoA synthetase